MKEAKECLICHQALDASAISVEECGHCYHYSCFKERDDISCVYCNRRQFLLLVNNPPMPGKGDYHPYLYREL